MKCPKCGKQNKKNSVNCKECNTPLNVVEQIDEVSDETVVVDEEIRKEIEKRIKPKKKKNIFKRIWIFIKLLILLAIISIVGLFVYVYSFYDYEKYFEENINRYYETENSQYLDNIKLFFRVYKFDDKKISKVQNNTYEAVNGWINEVKEKEYSNNKELINDLDNLQNIINDLYTKTDVDGHTALTKKSHSSLDYAIVDLKEMYHKDEPKEEKEEDKKDNKKEDKKDNEKEEETPLYDVSKFKEINISQALSLFDSTKVSVIYIGRENCGHCVNMVPEMKKTQEELGFKFYYINLNEINYESEDYADFYDKLDIMYEMNKETQKFNEYMGYTPMLIVIKNGRMVDGHIGYLDSENITDFLEGYIK